MDSLGTDFDGLLARGATIALLVAAAWAIVVVAAVALEARTQGRIRLARHTGCPARVRLWLLGLFVALFTGVAPAQASDAGSGPGPTTTIDAALDGLPLPDRAVGGATAVVVVRPGDSLWAIARAGLPRTADEASVVRTVAALHALNHRTIGPDPDLIRPGQHLVFPSQSTLSEEP